MTRDIVQALINTRVENEIDIESVVDELAAVGILSRAQADAVVRIHLAGQSVADAADAMDVSESRVYNARQKGEQKLLAAEETLAVLGEARREVRPDPYE